MDLSLRIGGSLLWVADGVCFPQIHAPGRDRQPAERRLAGPSRGLGGLYDDRTQGGDMERYDQGAGHAGLDIAGLYTTVDWGVVYSLVQAGFSLLIWCSQAEYNLLQAIIASGSALSTLGFLTPPGIAGQLLSIPEGAMGLGIVVFLFTFIPGYQTTIQAREVKVAWLYARTGSEPVGFALVEWFHRSGRPGDMPEVWEEWEVWFRNLIETHTLAPVLGFVPTVHRNQT
jgi:hypothetical protein